MRIISKKLVCLLMVLNVILNSTPPASAQTQTTGAVQGYVLEVGARQPVAAAVVAVMNEDTGLERTTVTNADGLYFISLLPPGRYTLSATCQGYENDPNSSTNNFPIRLSKTNVVQPPPILLRRSGAAPSTAAAPAAAPATAPGADSQVERLANTLNATRGGNFDSRQLILLPLPGIRTFESLAFLLPGVAPPPQPLGSAVGPGLGAGIGTSGQFSVNGQRSRANNFTVDGSDNNDEDVGVRRQGFVALVPQSIESIQEFQVFTHLWEAGVGRNLGSQVNAVSRSGTKQIHGTLYDFFTHRALHAHNFFDYTSDRAQQFPLTARARFANGSTQVVPVLLDRQAVVARNPSEDRDPFQRNQGGAAMGFPILHDKTFFFGSFERQDVKAREETHFAVPTVAERGFLGFGATGRILPDRTGRQHQLFPTSSAGDAVFSLFPFPNNPVGPYGENTFTQVLPASAEGTVFSLKLDHNFTLFGPNIRHTFTARYNFTHDERQVPAVGGAIFAGIEPRVRTQNLSLFLDSQLAPRLFNQVRISYGRTRLRFDPIRDLSLRPSIAVPGDPFLLNAELVTNLTFTFPGVAQPAVNYFRTNLARGTEGTLGSTGQVIIAPFSPVGLDVYLFPQARTTNTYQLADTMNLLRGAHTLKFGADLRRAQLNSFLNRNFRPQIVFGGMPDLRDAAPLAPIPDLSRFGPTPGFFSGADLASLGLPSGILQSLAIGTPDSTIGLRFWQYNFFFNDNWRVRRGLTVDYGLRYEYNTVPREANGRIENTFSLDLLPAVDPSLSVAVISQNQAFPFQTSALTAAFGQSLAALRGFLSGREQIYDPDRNNFGPHLGLAWDPFAADSTQAGRTAVRAGIGVYYDVTLGSVVSQSRNVFPTFVPINVDAITFSYLDVNPFFMRETGFFAIFNPVFAPLQVVDNRGVRTPLLRQGTLNVIGAPAGALQPLLGLLFNRAGAGAGLLPSGGGLAFTLPDRQLRSPYALHFNLQVDRELRRDFLLNVAYVGSRGVRLTRFRTPNGGPNSTTGPYDLLGLSGVPPLPPAYVRVPLSSASTLTRPNAGLGAYTIFDSSAVSGYHALQTSLTKRFSGGWQMTAAYAWSHAIDDVSDVFDLAGAFTFPQDDRNLRAERGAANFDVRHRFVYSMLGEVPFLRRFNDRRGAAGLLLGGWQFASVVTYQTGQPFTLNTSFDVNQDGNLTDRPNTTSGITIVDRGPQRLVLTAPATSLLAPREQNGQVGRNVFRARGIARTDVALVKNFRVSTSNTLVLRVEAFNFWNRTHFGTPVRILEAPGFGSSVDTLLAPRQVQFALKYLF
jgi:hypothetical protein